MDVCVPVTEDAYSRECGCKSVCVCEHVGMCVCERDRVLQGTTPGLWGPGGGGTAERRESKTSGA